MTNHAVGTKRHLERDEGSSLGDAGGVTFVEGYRRQVLDELRFDTGICKCREPLPRALNIGIKCSDNDTTD